MTNIATFNTMFETLNQQFESLNITEISNQMAILKLLNIETYKQDGFVKVCDVLPMRDGTWHLINQHEYLFEDHSSWVYAICSGNEIVKIGETGLPLGIQSKRGDSSQPVIGTHNRFGRLRGFGNIYNSKMLRDTDVKIRSELFEEAQDEKISIWAKRCDLMPIRSKIYGEPFETVTTYHKQLEKAYLTTIQRETGILPRLNSGRI
jgi:hypothetical protein